MRASKALRISGKPADNGLLKRTLEIESRLVTFDPSLAETFQDRANVFMLVLDQAATLAEESLRCAITLGLVERLPRKLY